MILTVTLNPLLERRLFFDSVEFGKDNRSKNEIYSAGGKGINVSRQLNLLGIKNYAFTFLGGNNGKIFRNLLNQEKIEFGFFSTKSETRSAQLIIDEKSKKLTTFFGKNSTVTKEEAEEFKAKLNKMIRNCSIVVFSGSSPSEETDDIFSYGISSAHQYDKISVLDTYGNHLSKSIDASPTVIHNNKHEIEKSLDVDLANEKSILEYLQFLYSKKIKLAFVTDGPYTAYASKYDFHYKIIPPEISALDGTGSGDAFVAGLVYGIENSLVFDAFVKIAIALGAANASTLETCSVTHERMNELVDKVRIEPIGKKMKIIDDSPNY